MVLLQVNGAAMEGRHSCRDLKRAYGATSSSPFEL
jgi:hypothetical protein